MGNGGRFHFYGNGLREVVANFRQGDRTVDESVAADDQASSHNNTQIPGKTLKVVRKSFLQQHLHDGRLRCAWFRGFVSAVSNNWEMR
jgi:hypothetical protein